tara:strand:- start:791 stop:1507 length:717 start_codon:yes stop_codon:yes gene_type:complete
MRTNEQINLIKKSQSDPVQHLNFITQEDIKKIVDYYSQNENEVETKSTGPKCLYIKEGDGVLDNVIDKLRNFYGNFKVRNAQIFDVATPHVIHIDDGKDLPNSYKAFTLPLRVEWEQNAIDKNMARAKLVFFDQHYYGGPVKFFNGETVNENTKVHYNTPLTNYNDVEGTNNKGIPEEVKNLLTHLRPHWLEGLSVQCYFPWLSGSCIAFNSLQLHSASDFNRQGIIRKLGVSIFTTI